MNLLPDRPEIADTQRSVALGVTEAGLTRHCNLGLLCLCSWVSHSKFIHVLNNISSSLKWFTLQSIRV